MRIARYALCAAIAALVAGCGGSAPPIDGSDTASVNFDSDSHHQTFHYTGSEQSFVVPRGVSWMNVVMLGAAGGGPLGGRGGRVFAEIPVTRGERLSIFVGGTATGLSGGYNGGGDGAYGTTSGFGGGGASDIRQGSRLRDRILVAGGGGGGGIYNDNGGAGGRGGGTPADNGSAGKGTACEIKGTSISKTTAGGGGTGGAQRAGGSGGSGGCGGYQNGRPGLSGSKRAGGAGGEGASDNGGGGGGGGYYGGGGGGGGGWDYGDEIGGGGGGGGGSSYVEPRARKYQSWRGWETATGNGIIVLSWR